MFKTINRKNQRYPRAVISPFTTNTINRTNPWVAAWWSAAFPGFGHMFLGRYITGFVLTIWEIILNLKANINLAIIYSFTGQFDQAREVLDYKLFIVYIGAFVFGIWDSYRISVEMNKRSVLADRTDPVVDNFSMSPFSINCFEKRNPWVSAAWSCLVPGLGHVYIHRLATGFFVLIIWALAVYFSRMLVAMHLTLTGAFSEAAAVIDPAYFLFLPSLYGFSIYCSYVYTVEYNKVFKAEQAGYLKANYQSPDSKMPC
ncbi:hypothetical protein [Pelotomaculum propionicicum]|mgnify:CR=1 FL=1|uniref:Uncharacterized protein n=1 Tax=Pelotomaculum propionicicum TaxID=258475 RepID=A0A4Y7RS16_9FIRM|nr:hypothetical protein [Pelotomaculum propionicicum]TEB11788.1 hypothetical protein Pmgp_01366 [Pelotomaculum propionicicum]